MDWQSIKENIKENIKETTSNIYSYLEDILIIKEYEINRDDDLITKTEMFVLRYRRILGIILLCILLYIWYNCDINKRTSNLHQTGGGNNIGTVGLFNEAEKSVKSDEQMAQERQKGKKKMSAEEIEKRKAAGQAKRNERVQQRGGSQPATPATPATPETPDTPATKSLSRWDKAKAKSQMRRSAMKDTLSKTSIGKFAEKQKGEMAEMRKAGFTKTQARAQMLYNVGAAAGEKAKEFAGWLYEILFAIAISLAICMVILPSLSFFIVGLICYFLLKSKMSSLKSA